MAGKLNLVKRMTIPKDKLFRVLLVVAGTAVIVLFAYLARLDL
jgi:hypothetical protein